MRPLRFGVVTSLFKVIRLVKDRIRPSEIQPDEHDRLGPVGYRLGKGYNER